MTTELFERGCRVRVRPRVPGVDPQGGFVVAERPLMISAPGLREAEVVEQGGGRFQLQRAFVGAYRAYEVAALEQHEAELRADARVAGVDPDRLAVVADRLPGVSREPLGFAQVILGQQVVRT